MDLLLDLDQALLANPYPTVELRIAVGHIVERFPKLLLLVTPRSRANQGLRRLESLKLAVD